MSIVAILNPKSANGNAARTWAKVRAHLPESVRTIETMGPGHATELTADAIRAGAKTIVAVGGDGTINEVVNGFFDDGRAITPDAKLAIVPHGTGSDFQRVLNLPWEEEKAARLILTEEPRMVDVLRVLYTGHNGRLTTRYSINVTSFGMGGEVAARVNRSSKLLGGGIAFLAATLRTALTFSGVAARVTLDDEKTIEARITNVAVGNGQYHGAGMWVCPGASLEDGLLDVTVIEYLSAFQMLRSLPSLYNGAIYQHPKVRAFRAKRVKAESSQPSFIEIDGEPVGRLPVEIEIVPRALRILMR